MKDITRHAGSPQQEDSCDHRRLAQRPVEGERPYVDAIVPKRIWAGEVSNVYCW
jgi:hypothetical protein